MPTRYAAIYGGAIGFLFSVVIVLIYDIGIVDAAYRSLILTMVGAWIAATLAGLDDLLSPSSADNRERKRENHPS